MRLVLGACCRIELDVLGIVLGGMHLRGFYYRCYLDGGHLDLFDGLRTWW